MTEEHPQAADSDRLAGLDRPLRNRVTPAGELIATPHRGTMYGNRGVLHNDDLALVRRYQVRRWLVCVLEFRGRRRPDMRPGRYTELFFSTRRSRWPPVPPLRGMPPPGLPVVPDRLDTSPRPARETRGGRHRPGAAPAAPPGLRGPRTYPALLRELPDGVFIARDGESWLVHDGGLPAGPRPGTPTGLTRSTARPRC